MTNAIICDRCETAVEGDGHQFNTGSIRGELDLCADCCRAFHRWMDQEPVNPFRNAMRAHSRGEIDG